jgi:hypothetical protein
LRRGVGEAREAAHAHPHIQVHALDVRRADMRLVGIAGDGRLDRAVALCRAVFAFRAGVIQLAVDLHQHRVIDLGAERAGNSVQV